MLAVIPLLIFIRISLANLGSSEKVLRFFLWGFEPRQTEDSLVFHMAENSSMTEYIKCVVFPKGQ